MMTLTAMDLACVRGEREIFRGLSFALGAGAALALTGPNGSGKSSLLRLIAGLLHPATGTLTLDNGAAEQTIAEQSHYLSHRDALKPALSVAENLAFWHDFLGGADRGAPGRALRAVGLGHVADFPAAFLSAGQRRRLSIARLIAVHRPIWLLDEPTSALDANAQDMLAQLMRAHLDAGGLIVAATHGPLGLNGLDELRIDNFAPVAAS